MVVVTPNFQAFDTSQPSRSAGDSRLHHRIGKTDEEAQEYIFHISCMLINVVMTLFCSVGCR